MKIRRNPYRIGDIVRVKRYDIHTLPTGLPERAKVKVVNRDTGFDEVEFEGQRFTVAAACIDSGFNVVPE